MAEDYIVIGAGVIGLCVARELRRRFPSSPVTLFEKEPRLGAHASGRNSGVLHAGFYYAPDSLKARFTRIGNEQMTAYCESRGLPVNRCGKLVVATREEELPRLEELHRRGLANNVPLQMIDAIEARDIEPRAIVHERAIFSPTTSTVDPLAVLESLHRDAIAEGVDIRLGTAFREAPRNAFVINAAGLHADTIARQFGFARTHRILPFRGVYLYSNEPRGALRTHVYPVPDPLFPFLGVHFTVGVDGAVKIGPTAAPALWREQYGGLANLSLRELGEIALRGSLLLASDASLRRHAVDELRKLSRASIVARAATLVRGVHAEDYRRWGKPGIRAQLYDTKRRALEMDFVIEGDERSLHILNAVSPGFTCAMPFAQYVVDAAGRRNAVM
jgi:(S)-2-hydroxyglutarate dehydrogenase